MSRKVVFSKRFRTKLYLLFDYLETEWTIKVRNEFEEKLYSSINTIVQMPEIFPKSDLRKSNYKCVVTKQTTIFYSFNSKEIKIADILDTRQDPKNIKIS